MKDEVNKVVSIEIFKYSIPFIKTLFVFSNKLLKREGFILKINYQNKNCRYTEIAPLFNVSQESLNDAYHQLISVCELLKKGEKLEIDKLYPSVLFGIFSISNFYDKPFSIPYSGLIYHKLDQNNFIPTLNTYKIKLSMLPVDESVSLIKQIKNRFPKLKLRLDINQSWSYSEAFYFMTKFAPDDFEYIEEPCRSIDETKKVLKETKHKIALDESLISWDLKEISKYKNIKALVIKPMLTNFLKYLKCKIPLVFSSSFETGIGLSNIARLARAYSKSPPGIDTYKFLKYDVLKKPIQFGTEMRLFLPIDLNKEVLKPCHRV